MKFFHKVFYFFSIVILTILLGLVEALLAKHLIEFFTYDPYIELIAIGVCLIIILPVSVYLFSSRLPFIESLKNQNQRTKKKEDAKMSEL